MRERTAFERELRELLVNELEGHESELRGDWQKEQSFEKATLTTPDQFESKAIDVTAFRFPGSTSEVALVFAGVHGSEPQGVAVARTLLDKLKDASSKGMKPKLTTILIPELFDKKRNNGDRDVLVGGKKVEPNRNFPAPGEGYEYARLRGLNRADGAELLDCCGLKAAGDKVTHRMLAENRVLMQLIERDKPVRTLSIHSKKLPGTRGDGPGIFVDPRGGFNEHTGIAFTKSGQFDDALALDMLAFAAGLLNQGQGLPLKDNKNAKDLSHPLLGNFAFVPRSLLFTPTVHYTSTEHVCGTSFGMWAPVPEQSGVRTAITTVTAEVPKYNGTTASKAAAEVVRVYSETIAQRFLGL